MKVSKAIIAISALSILGGCANHLYGVDAPIDRDGIERSIHSKKTDYRACYQREVATKKDSAKVEGTVVVKFLIEASGNVHEARVDSSTVDNENLEKCILGVLKNTVFQKPEKGIPITVNYPFRFMGQVE